MIQAEHLQKTFRVRKRNAGFKNAAKAFFSREYEEIHALNDVSFRIEDGEAVGYIGPNGAGQTTIFNTITGLSQADGGRILFQGQYITKREPHEAAHLGIARTFQNIRLF